MGRIARVGDHAVPVPVEFEDVAEEGGPTTRMIFDEVDGRLECREVSLTATPSGREVRKSDLRDVLIDAARDQVMEDCSNPWEVTRGGRTIRVLPFRSRDEAVAARRSLDKARRRLTDEDLRRIARVYQGDTLGAPTRAVAEAFDVAHRTATLYVHKARQAGLIPPVGASQPTKGED